MRHRNSKRGLALCFEVYTHNDIVGGEGNYPEGKSDEGYAIQNTKADIRLRYHAKHMCSRAYRGTIHKNMLL